MKQKLSITIDKDKIKELNRMLKEGRFRSRSHILEYSLNKFLKSEKDSGGKNA
jgi:Arc/MetJ-type ribon-helix-helix transcriptional regulator